MQLCHRTVALGCEEPAPELQFPSLGPVVLWRSLCTVLPWWGFYTVRMLLPGKQTWSAGVCAGLVGPRSYEVKVGERTFVRNRRHLIKADEGVVEDLPEVSRVCGFSGLECTLLYCCCFCLLIAQASLSMETVASIRCCEWFQWFGMHML
jgi:hypothetical protein